MPRPRSLSFDQIADAALTVIDRSGLASVSMRAVADELGMGTMSLYRYVASRDELEGLVVDRVVADVDPVVSRRQAWPARITTLVLRVRQAVAAHAEVVPLLLVRRHRTFGSLQWGESVLAALADGGIEGDDRVVAFRTLVAFTLGAVQAEHLSSLSGEGTAALRELAVDDYPNLVDAAAHARRVTPDQEFRRGLAVVLRGLAPPQDG